MVVSWLKSNLFKVNQANFTNMRHIVLGTNLKTPLTNQQEEVLFGCGCFWGAEKGFWKLPGVETTAVGYAGGGNEDPNYNQVCSGKTGHTEVVRVVWNKQDVASGSSTADLEETELIPNPKKAHQNHNKIPVIGL